MNASKDMNYTVRNNNGHNVGNNNEYNVGNDDNDERLANVAVRRKSLPPPHC